MFDFGFDAPDLSEIDIQNPIDWSHPLNQGRLLWSLTLPGRYGGPTAFDLVQGWPGSLVGFTSGYGWSPVSYPGSAGSFYYNGSSNFAVTFPDVPAIRPNTFTVGGWFMLTGSVPFAPIFVKPYNGTLFSGGWSAPYVSWLIRVNSSSVISFEGSPNGTYTTLTPSYTTTTGTWYRMVGTYDGATMKLYMNGVLVGTQSAAVGTGIAYGNTSYVIGADYGGELFPGYINDCFLSSAVWDAGMVGLDYALGPQGYTGVLRRRRRVVFSAPSGTTLYGSGSVSLTGTVTGQASPTLHGNGSVSLAGSLTAQASPAQRGQGSVSLSGSVTGKASLSLAAQGSVSLGGSVSAAASPSLTARGSVSLSGSVAGAGQVQQPGILSGKGNVSLTGSVSASAVLSLSGKGTATASGSVSTQAQLSFSAKGIVSLQGAASAQPSLSLSGRGALSLESAASATPNVFLTALGAVSLQATVTGRALLPSAIYGHGGVSLIGTLAGSASGIAAMFLPKPDMFFVEPARPLLFVEPARSLYFVVSA